MSKTTSCVLSFVIGVVLTLIVTYKAPSTGAPAPTEKSNTCALPESLSKPLAECKYRLQDCIVVSKNILDTLEECVDKVELNTKRLTDAAQVTEDCMYQLSKCKSK